MQMLVIVWQPNAKWEALDNRGKRDYLQSLDDYINGGRAAGMVVLGWSKIDQDLPKAPAEGFVGVFGVKDSDQVHELENLVGEAKWYEYFDSTNISINLRGSTEPQPHTVYAELLGVPLN